MSPFKVTPSNIWNFRQNKASLVVKDLVGADASSEVRDGIYKILLARGVFKWFAVRREVVQLKNRWKSRITRSIECQKEAGAWGYWNWVWYYKGYRAGLEECRAEIRALCHSDRWSADPKDQKALAWLKSQERKWEAETQGTQPPAPQEL